MEIKGVNAKAILNSRKEKTILVAIKTSVGRFSASAPSGKSRGRYEARPYKTSLENDIKIIKKLDIKYSLNSFNDLDKIEKTFRDKIGANSMFALESALLKALARQQKKQIWEIINNKARRLPYPVGNVVGGGLHSSGKKPDFQEFLVIPRTERFVDGVFLMKQIHKNLRRAVRAEKKNDENAWQTSLGNEKVLNILDLETENLENQTGQKIEIGLDIAASSFYKNGKYYYKNPKKIRTKKQQIEYISELINKFDIFYIEDPLNEQAFRGFQELRRKTPRGSLIVGDDLSVTNLKRIKKAKKNFSVDAVIIKPNQNGSLLEVAKIIDFCRRKNIKTIMSHRSGETKENIIADLAFAWQCDFIKTGVVGKERDAKLKRLIQIEKSL